MGNVSVLRTRIALALQRRPASRPAGRGLWLLPAAVLLAAAGCGAPTYPFDYFNEMHNQPIVRAQEPPRLSPPTDSVPTTGREAAVDFGQAGNLRNPLQRTPANLSQAGKLFQTNCSMCHGPEGKGNGPLVKYFTDARVPPPVDFSQPRTKGRSEGQIWYIMTNGLGAMPSFKNLLTPEERWLITMFVQDVR